MVKPEDLPEEIREILNQPCSTCGRKGIHDCKYDEKKLLERLEKEDKEKKKLKPEKVKRFEYKSTVKNENRNNTPEVGIGCSICEKQVQTKDGLCLDCTKKQREEAKNKPIVLRDRWGKEIGKRFKHR